MQDDIRDDYRDQRFARLEVEANGERQACRALEQAIRHHCRGEYVPEDVARFCRTEAVNLDRELDRSRGLPLGPMRGRLEDFYERSKETSQAGD